MEDQQDLTSKIKSYIQQDNFKEALRLSSAHSKDQGNYFFKYYVGLSHKLLGQIEDAICVFEDFEEEQFRNIEKQLKIDLLQNMAEIYYNKQLYHKSAEYYFRLLELDKSKPSSFNQAINSLIKLNRINEAEEIAKKGINKFPVDKDLIINLAKCYRIEKKYKEAIELLKQFVIGQSESDCNIQQLLSNVYYDAEMYEDFEKLNQSILDQDKNNIQAIANLSKVKINSLNLDEAYKLCQRGINIKSDFALFYYNQGISQYLSGDLVQSIGSIENACFLNLNKCYEIPLSLVIIYIEKGYLTQDFQWFDVSYQFLQTLDGDLQTKHISENPIFQYLHALLLRLTSKNDQFQSYWTQIFHIQTANLAPVSRHPSLDFYESLDKKTQDLIGLIQQLDFFSQLKVSNEKIQSEIENQKTLLFFYILKTISIPSNDMKKYKYQEIQMQIRNICRYQEIYSDQFQLNNQQLCHYQSNILEQQINLNIYEIQGSIKEKKDKEFDEFFQTFFDITQSIIDITYEHFKKGLKLNEKIQNQNSQHLKIFIFLSTVELDEYKKIGNLSVEDLQLPQKFRKLFDIIQVGNGMAFKQSIQNCFNGLDKKLIKNKLSKKSDLKNFIVQLNSYKNNDDELFTYKTPSVTLAYDYACKFFSTLLMDNLTDIQYQSYYIQYLQTTAQSQKTSLLLDILKSIETYSHKNMNQSFIQNQKGKKHCNIF